MSNIRFALPLAMIAVLLPGASVKTALAESYKLREVRQDKEYYYAQGSVVYILRAPGDETWVMKTSSKEIPSNLGNQLYVPAGWRFEMVSLPQELIIDPKRAGGVLYVITDELGNEYIGCGLNAACNYRP